MSPDRIIFLVFLIVTLPCPTAAAPNSLTTGVDVLVSNLYAIPKIPIDWFPSTSIVPSFSTSEPFTAYTPTALSFTVFEPFSTSIPDVESNVTLP